MEIWKEFIENRYWISNKGSIKSKRKILKQPLSNKGYPTITLDRKRYQTHRLVAKLFIDNPENKPQVNHKDGDKTNNNVNNLEWVTNSENQKHAYQLGLQKKKIGKSYKLNDRQINSILSAIKLGAKKIDMAKLFGVSRYTIYRVWQQN